MNSALIYFIVALIATLLNYFTKPLLIYFYGKEKKNFDSLITVIRLILLLFTTVFCILAVAMIN
jgi:hypothetical protein